MTVPALFLNGVYERILSDMAEVHAEFPDQVLYLQPYSGSAIVEFRNHRPSPGSPVQLLASTTKNPGLVCFVGEIVDWRDKGTLSESAKRIISRLILALQCTEPGLYEEADGSRCVNLLSVRRLRELPTPFNVEDLRLTRKQRPPKGKRTTAGSWWYVEHVDV